MTKTSMSSLAAAGYAKLVYITEGNQPSEALFRSLAQPKQPQCERGLAETSVLSRMRSLGQSDSRSGFGPTSETDAVSSI